MSAIEDGSTPKSHLCSACDVCWPGRSTYANCPLCGTTTAWHEPYPSISAAEAVRLVERKQNLARFEAYYEARELMSLKADLEAWEHAA